MAIGKWLRASVPGVILSWGSRLRFPYLFLLTAIVFVADVLIPDVIPLADEIVIGLLTLLLASLKKKPEEPVAEGAINADNTGVDKTQTDSTGPR